MKGLFPILAICFLCGCSYSYKSDIPDEALIDEARLATITPTELMLRNLPPAKRPVMLSVYRFDDMTGQTKPSETPQYSRAVTQGGLAILEKALLDASNHKWFKVLERDGLQNLLQERKIIQTMRGEYVGESGKKLPALSPLLYSGVILEGGIVSYESNVQTGGAGARYLGIGGNTKYSRDMVTVYLRLVNVKNGEVLLSVNTSKTIYSVAVSGDLYMFVSFDKLAESELGYTENEPPQLAVRQAIEMSVYAMIMEGYKDNLWTFADEAAGRKVFLEYAENYLEEENPEKLLVTPITDTVPAAAQQKVIEPKPKQITKKKSAAEKLQAKKLAVKKEKAKLIETTTGEKQKKASIRLSQTTPTKRSKPEATEADLGTQEVPPGWYVHVFAVRTIGGEEQRIIDALRRAGLPVFLQRTAVSSIPYYRILIGAHGSKEDAERNKAYLTEVSQTLSSKTLERSFLITKF